MNYYFKVLKTYSFQGRARRKEFWLFYLINGFVCSILSIILRISTISNLSYNNTYTLNGSNHDTVLFQGIMFIIIIAYLLISFIPSIAVGVRRLHDIGISGKWIIVLYVSLIIPPIFLVVLIIFLVLSIKDSQEGNNRFGPNPKIDNI